jgi:hypothetical protein
MIITYGKSYKYLWGYWSILLIVGFIILMITSVPIISVGMISIFMYTIAYSQFKSGVALNGMGIGKYRRKEERFLFWMNIIWSFLLPTVFLACGFLSKLIKVNRD